MFILFSQMAKNILIVFFENVINIFGNHCTKNPKTVNEFNKEENFCKVYNNEDNYLISRLK